MPPTPIPQHHAAPQIDPWAVASGLMILITAITVGCLLTYLLETRGAEGWTRIRAIEEQRRAETAEPFEEEEK